MNASGTVDTSFIANANSYVYSIAVKGNDKILVGGSFTSIGGQSRGFIAGIEVNGKIDKTLNANIVGSSSYPVVYAIALQPDGKILIGGDFISVLGVARNSIARLNVDGTLDTTFNPGADSLVFSIVVQPDGKILACGTFRTIGGQARNFM